VAEALGIAAGIFQVVGHLGAFGFHRLQGVKVGQGRVGLWSCGQIQGSLGQVELAFRQADPVVGGGTGGHHAGSLGVCKAYILAGRDKHAPEDEAWLLAGIDHPGQPVQRGVGVRAPYAFYEGTGRIVVAIAVPVVQHRPFLYAFLGGGHAYTDL
jgi:hypothetical protein